jgi:hypothetical protein
MRSLARVRSLVYYTFDSETYYRRVKYCQAKKHKIWKLISEN